LEKDFWLRYRDRGLVVVGINTGEQSDDRATIAAAFRQKHGLTYPIWLDAEDRTMELYGGDGFPTNAVVAPDGTLRYSQSGFDEAALRGVIEKLIQNP
jgi:peroxiredoxin